MLEWIRFIISAALIALGLVFEISAVIGIFRFHYVLNRMHAAALGDTMGLMCILLGLVVSNGIGMLSLKLIVLIVLFWMTSPVSSHMIGRLELETNRELVREVRVWKH